MDSNRRHHLAQNDLANYLISQYDEWIKPNGHLISWVIIAVLVLAVGVVAYSNLHARNRSLAWQQYYAALSSVDPEGSLETIINTTTGDIADQARITLGQIRLGEAGFSARDDKTKTEEKLQKAIVNFEAAKKNAVGDLQRQASWGLAQVYETLATLQTDSSALESAKKEYKILAERWPNDYLGQKAVKQLAFVSRPDTAKFFELTAKKANEAPKGDDFKKVEIDTKDPFGAGMSFDALEALGEPSGLGGDFAAPVPEAKKSVIPEGDLQQTDAKQDEIDNNPDKKDAVVKPDDASNLDIKSEEANVKRDSVSTDNGAKTE